MSRIEPVRWVSGRLALPAFVSVFMAKLHGGVRAVSTRSLPGRKKRAMRLSPMDQEWLRQFENDANKHASNP